MKLGVLIVAFRSRKDLAELLPPLKGSADICVVDNASDDGTAQWVRRYAPWVDLVANEQNIGFAAAINQGMARLADCEAVLWLNPDARIAASDLARLARFLSVNEDVAAVGPAIERGSQMEPSLLKRPVWWRTWLFLLTGMRAYGLGGMTGRPAPGYPWQQACCADHLRGSCMLVRMQAWRDVGPMDERFFLYFEETQWCLRARRKGWRICIEPAAKAFHRGKGSVRTVEAGVPMEYLRSAVLFWHLVHPFAAWILRGTLMAMLSAKWMLAGLFGRREAKRWLSQALRVAVDPFGYPPRYPNARRPGAWDQ